MSAFVFNNRMQSLSQRVGQVNCHIAETPDGEFLAIDFWRWQFWAEKGDGEWDAALMSVGDARELAHSILEQIGKAKS